MSTVTVPRRYKHSKWRCTGASLTAFVEHDIVEHAQVTIYKQPQNQTPVFAAFM